MAEAIDDTIFGIKISDINPELGFPGIPSGAIEHRIYNIITKVELYITQPYFTGGFLAPFKALATEFIAYDYERYDTILDAKKGLMIAIRNSMGGIPYNKTGYLKYNDDRFDATISQVLKSPKVNTLHPNAGIYNNLDFFLPSDAAPDRIQLVKEVTEDTKFTSADEPQAFLGTMNSDGTLTMALEGNPLLLMTLIHEWGHGTIRSRGIKPKIRGVPWETFFKISVSDFKSYVSNLSYESETYGNRGIRTFNVRWYTPDAIFEEVMVRTKAAVAMGDWHNDLPAIWPKYKEHFTDTAIGFLEDFCFPRKVASTDITMRGTLIAMLDGDDANIAAAYHRVEVNHDVENNDYQLKTAWRDW